MVREERNGSGKSWGKRVKCLNMLYETLKNKCMFFLKKIYEYMVKLYETRISFQF